MRELASPRLRLEPQTSAHADEMFVVLADPAIYAHENAPPPSPDWLRERYRRLETRRSGDGSEQWLNWVVRLAEGPAIGYVQATVRTDGVAAIGYELGSTWWGRGLAREAVEAMLHELASQYGVRRLHAVLKRDNVRSMRLLQRLGFTAATPREPARSDIEADEAMMCRHLAQDPSEAG
jgi:RimJ/RimL family protein N-acetyltransferase